MDTPPPTITPQPVLTPAEGQVRTWSMLAHLSALAGFVLPLGNLLGPFLIWQLRKHDMPAVVAQAREALNFQLSCLIYLIVSGLLIFILIGAPLMVAVGLFNLVCVIIASLRANDGVAWRYPLTIRFFA